MNILQRHARDFTPERADQPLPLAVTYPRATGEVVAVLQAARAAGISVVPQGGLSGMAGAAIPGPGSVALSLEKFTGIDEIDLAADTMTVCAGTTLQAVQEKAGAHGRFFPLDFGSRGTCTIGGAVATNAGGNRVLRFGMMRDLILGLEVVLADGTVVTALNKMLKNNAGYDLRHLFIGSEGTLGVVTRAVLKLFPAPRSCNTILCAVTGYDRCLELLALARECLGSQLSAFEVMWQGFYEMTHKVAGRPPLSPDAGTHFVLMETLGSNEAADQTIFSSFTEATLDRGVINDAVIAASMADAQALWRIRDSSGDLARLWGVHCVNFDVSVPVGAIERFTNECSAALDETFSGIRVVFFGHIADSNMHVAVQDPDRTRKPSIDRIVYSVVRSMGGSVSAEHGIGLDKRDYLDHSRSAAEIRLMRSLKSVLDPTGLLNPGKVFPVR